MFRLSLLTLAGLFCLGLILQLGLPRNAIAAPMSLALVSAMPQGEVENLSQITVRFSEAMRPLGVMNEEASSSPLQLQVPGGTLPAGNFRWLDPASLAYIFDAPVAGPLKIKASVAAGAQALSGAELQEEFSWELNTPPLSLELVSAGEDLPPEGAQILISSNYALDLAGLREKAALRMGAKPLRFELSESVYGGYGRGRQSSWFYTFSILDTLEQDQNITLDIAAGVPLVGGFAPAPSASFTCKSFETLRVTAWNAGWRSRNGSEGNERLMGPEEAVYISFNNPVRLKDLLEKLSLDPRSELNVKLEEFAEESRRDWVLPFAWLPRARYALILSAGLEDAFGTALAKESRLAFRTGDYAPFFHLPDGALLEKALGGKVPLSLRNHKEVEIRLHYLPWPEGENDDPAALALYAQGIYGGHPAEFPNPPGSRHKIEKLDFSERPNENIRHELDIPALLGFDSAADLRGLIAMQVILSHPEQSGPLYPGFHYLQISELGLTVQAGRDRSLAWVTELESGKPLAGADLTLYDADLRPVWSGASDGQGLAELPGQAEFARPMRLLLARLGDAVSVLSLTGDSLPQSCGEFAQAEESGLPWRVHLSSQLPLYQPGQEVNYTLFARVFREMNAEGEFLPRGEWQALAGEELELVIRDNRGREIHKESASANAYGSISGSFSLSSEAALGHYYAEVRRTRFGTGQHSFAFQVAEFRPPDFKVDLRAPASGPTPLPEEAPLSIALLAGYFSGAKLPGAEAQLEAGQRPAFFSPSLLSGYATGADTPFYRSPYPFYEQGEAGLLSSRAVLDDEGRAVFSLPEIKVEAGRPQDISLRATVTDASGLTTQGATSFRLHPAALYAGLRAPFIASQGADFEVAIKAATWDDKPVARARVRLSAERTDRINERELVWEKELSLEEAQGGSFAVSLERSGAYELTVRIRDERGRENLSRTTVYVPGPDLRWHDSRSSEGLEIMADAPEYLPGETARLLLRNPFDRAYALVSTERNGIRTYAVQEVSGPAPVIELPLGESDAPYVHASVTLVKGRNGLPQQGQDPDAPRIAHGKIRLDIKADKPELLVELSTDAAEYRPGAEVKLELQSSDTKGNLRRTQLTVLAVDERILRAAGESNQYNPAVSFAPLYSCGPLSADTRVRLLNLSLPGGGHGGFNGLLRMAAPMAAPVAEMSIVQDTAAELTGAQPESEAPRENFSPLAFWLGAAETDQYGKLSVNFTLPDTLTSYRLAVIATDGGSSFATAEERITVSKPLQLLSALPRFLTEGDKLEARILVQNLSPQRGKITVRAEAAGLILQESEQEIELEAGGSGLVSFPLAAGDPGTGELRVSGRMGEEADAAVFSLPILPALPLTAVAAAGLLDEGQEFLLPVELPAPLDQRSRLDVVFAPSPASGLTLTAQTLLEYPWDCLEQRFSRAFVRILRLRHGELLGLEPDDHDRELIGNTFEAAAGFQQGDGGFALWSGLSSNYYLTAYVLLVNEEAGSLGLGLDSEVKDAAYGYLRRNLEQRYRDEDRYAGSPAWNYSLSSDALALWLFARRDAGRDARFAAGMLDALLERAEREQAAPMVWGALILTVRELDGMDDSEKSALIDKLLLNLEKTAAVTPTQLHFAAVNTSSYWMTMGSTLRDNGLALGALVLARPDYPRLEALAHWLSQGLGEKKVLSTQEAIFGLWGLGNYLQSLGGNASVSLEAVWNEDLSLRQSFERLIDPPSTWIIPSSLLDPGNSSTLRLSALRGRPYWTARLRYASPSLPQQPENAGITLSRAWLTPGPWKMGDVIEVAITVTVPASRRHVLLFDPFPAGLEPLYASRADLDYAAMGYQYPWQWQENRTDGLLLYAENIEPGVYTYTYKLRAAAPGRFSRRPSTAEEMYTPEVFGRTTGDMVEVGS